MGKLGLDRQDLISTQEQQSYSEDGRTLMEERGRKEKRLSTAEAQITSTRSKEGIKTS